MKKILLTALLGLAVLTSCGGGAETSTDTDVKKVAETTTENEKETEEEVKTNNNYIIPEDNSDIWGTYQTRNDYTYTIGSQNITNSKGYAFQYTRISQNIIMFDGNYYFIQDKVLFKITADYVYIKK